MWVKGELLLDLPDGKKAYRLLQAGIIKGLSIGYRTVKEDFSAATRYLKEVILFEASLVLFPMNENALVTSVKSLDYSSIQIELKALKAIMKGTQ